MSLLPKNGERYFLVYSKSRSENEDLGLVSGGYNCWVFKNMVRSTRQIYAINCQALSHDLTWYDRLMVFCCCFC